METILIFAPLYPPHKGGGTVYFSTIVDSLAGEFSFIVITSYHPKKQLVETEDHVRIYRVIPRNDRLPGPVRALIEFFSTLVCCLYLLIFEDVAVVHAHSTSYSTPGVTLSSWVTRTPMIYDLRDTGFPKRLVTTGPVRAWFSCTPTIDSILVEQGVDESNIVRAPVVNPTYVKEYEIDEPVVDEMTDDQFVVGYVGKVRRPKGVMTLLNAFEQFERHNSDTHLKIVGGGPCLEDVRQYITENRLEDQTELTGWVNHKQALAHLSEVDVLVLPSRSEGLPRVITEAFEIGVPVVATPVGGIPDLIEDGNTGLLIEETPEEIRMALERLYHNPTLRNSIVKQAKDCNTMNDWGLLERNIKLTYQSTASNCNFIDGVSKMVS